MSSPSYARHRFPSAIIQHAVWLYFRFALSYRDVEDLLAERGIDVSYETVRRWSLKFGRVYAARIRRRRLRVQASTRGASPYVFCVNVDAVIAALLLALWPDYPMVAPPYTAKRHELAKKIGLGRKPRAPEPAPVRRGAARRRPRRELPAPQIPCQRGSTSLLVSIRIPCSEGGPQKA